MLVDRILPGASGLKFPVPQMDGFIGGEPGVLIEGGKEVFASEQSAWESAIDDYLFRFSEMYFEIAGVLGPRKAMNMILDRRNRDRLRCRLAAAKELADLATADPAALLALAAAADATDVYPDPAVIVRVREASEASEA